MQRRLLTDDEVASALTSLPGWHRSGESLTRQFTFVDFPEAFAFMTRVAFIAEHTDHHPNWSNVYNTVDIAISTHDRGGITDVDVDFATRVSELSP